MPPFQQNWAKVARIQAQSGLNNLELEKQNALPELNRLMGQELNQPLSINDTLRFVPVEVEQEQAGFWNQNALYRLADSKTSYAKSAEKISKSITLPNLFAVGNYNLFQRDLPVIIPDWFVGVELQWTLFNGQSRKRTQASRELIHEAALAEEHARESLEMQLLVSKNKMMSMQNDVTALDVALREANRTTGLVQARMENELASPKDVNEALLLEEEMSKAYYTAVLGYYLALANYFNVLGDSSQISRYIN